MNGETEEKNNIDLEDTFKIEDILLDKFVSLKESDHEHPYDDPFLLKIEDIFGFLMCHKKPYTRSTIKSLKNYRNKMRKHCRECIRFPDQCRVRNPETEKVIDTCRIFSVKSALTREIRGLRISIKGFGKSKSNVKVDVV